MRKIYLSVIAALFVAGANAQLTQTNHAPSNGDAYQMYQCDSLNINPGAAGAGVTWTFAMATHSSVIQSNLATTANNPSYPAATVSVSAGANNNSYYNSTAMALLYYGGDVAVGSQVAATLNYSAPAVYASYPMSLNTTSSSTTGGNINITVPITTSGTFLGNSTTLADGTGTLILPGNTYNNVIRVLGTQTVNFTTTLISGTLLAKVYEYYQAGTKAPVFSISSMTINSAAGTNTQTIVRRIKQPSGGVGINSVDLSNVEVSVFPNPSSEAVTFFTSHATANQVTICDLSGRQVVNSTLNGGSTIVSVSTLAPGIYFYQIQDADGTALKTGKITVTH